MQADSQVALRVVSVTETAQQPGEGVDAEAPAGCAGASFVTCGATSKCGGVSNRLIAAPAARTAPTATTAPTMMARFP